MKPIRVPPTRIDKKIADHVVEHARPFREKTAEALTWGADEHVLIAAASFNWIASRRGAKRERIAANHLLATAIVTGALPHILKYVFDQHRPDRLTALGHLHGIPVSGRADDAFPSGHAMHMGALAGAASGLRRPYREIARTASLGISLTRILVLAHWTSDIVVGFVGGFAIERMLRRWTGYEKDTPPS